MSQTKIQWWIPEGDRIIAACYRTGDFLKYYIYPDVEDERNDKCRKRKKRIYKRLEEGGFDMNGISLDDNSGEITPVDDEIIQQLATHPLSEHINIIAHNNNKTAVDEMFDASTNKIDNNQDVHPILLDSTAVDGKSEHNMQTNNKVFENSLASEPSSSIDIEKDTNSTSSTMPINSNGNEESADTHDTKITRKQSPKMKKLIKEQKELEITREKYIVRLQNLNDEMESMSIKLKEVQLLQTDDTWTIRYNELEGKYEHNTSTVTVEAIITQLSNLTSAYYERCEKEKGLDKRKIPSSDAKLSGWATRQRSKRHVLQPHKIALLNDIGFCWEIRRTKEEKRSHVVETSSDGQYVSVSDDSGENEKEVYASSETNSSSNNSSAHDIVPPLFSSRSLPANNNLKILVNQRDKLKDKKERCIDKLKSTNKKIEDLLVKLKEEQLAQTKNTWTIQYYQLKALYERCEEENLDKTRIPSIPKYKTLAAWASGQRSSALQPHRIALLDDIGFWWGKGKNGGRKRSHLETRTRNFYTYIDKLEVITKLESMNVCDNSTKAVREAIDNDATLKGNYEMHTVYEWMKNKEFICKEAAKEEEQVKKKQRTSNNSSPSPSLVSNSTDMDSSSPREQSIPQTNNDMSISPSILESIGNEESPTKSEHKTEGKAAHILGITQQTESRLEDESLQALDVPTQQADEPKGNESKLEDNGAAPQKDSIEAEGAAQQAVAAVSRLNDDNNDELLDDAGHDDGMFDDVCEVGTHQSAESGMRTDDSKLDDDCLKTVIDEATDMNINNKNKDSVDNSQQESSEEKEPEEDDNDTRVEYEAAINRYTTEIEQMKHQISGLKEQLSAVTIEREDIEKKVKAQDSQLKVNATETIKFQSSLDSITTKYEEASAKVEQLLEQITEYKDTISTIESKRDEFETKYETLKSEKTVSDSKYDNTISNLKRQVNESKATITKSTKQYKDLELKHQQYKNDLQQITKEKSELVSQVSAKGDTITQLTKKVNEKQYTISSLEARVTAEVLEKNDLQTQVASLTDKNATSELEVAAIKEEFNKSKDTISSLETGVQQLKEENEALHNKYKLVSNENDMKVQEVNKLLNEKKDMKIEHERELKRLKDTHKVNLDTLRLEMDASAKKSIDMLRSEADAKQLRVNELQSRLEISKSTCDDLSKELTDTKKQVQLEKDHLLVKEQHISNLKMKNDDLRKTNDNVVKRIMSTLHNSETEVRKLRAEVRKLQGIKKSTNLNGLPTGRGGRRKKQSDPITSIPKVKWDDIIGNQTAKDVLLELPMCRNANDDDLYEEEADEDDDNTGILFFGPHGTGKTLLAKALANQGNCSFKSVSPDTILNAYVGNSEKKMREIFNTAKHEAHDQDNTSILFFDECDRLFRKPGSNDCEVSSNITGIFQDCMDGVQQTMGDVVVLAATNHLELIPGEILSRFQNRIEVHLPDAQARIAITKLQIEKKTKDTLRSELKEADFDRLAEVTEGASGRDIKWLVKNTLKERVLSTKNHNGWWCKDEEDYYVPCYHSCTKKCKAEKFLYNQRPEAYKVRPPPLSYVHFKEAIDKYGVSPSQQD